MFLFTLISFSLYASATAKLLDPRDVVPVQNEIAMCARLITHSYQVREQFSITVSIPFSDKATHMYQISLSLFSILLLLLLLFT